MATGSQAWMKPAENPLSTKGAAAGTGKPGYSQDLHQSFTAREVPRSLPFSEDGEKGVLCSLLLSPRDVADICVLHLRSEAFYIPAHEIIYGLVLEFGDKRKPIDFVALKQALKDRNQLEEIGGQEYLSDLYNFVPTAANAGYYIDIVREKYVLRRLISACNRLSTQCYDQQGEMAQLLDEAEKEIFAITGEHVKTEIVPTRDLVMEAIEQIEKLYENRGSVTGLPTGFVELDRMTNGLHADEGFLSERDFPNPTAAASQASAAKMFIDDTPGLTVTELRAKARRLKSQHDIQLIVIDYLQLLRSMSRRAQDNRQLEISEISSGIKALAKELSLPIIVIAQLNRQPDTRAKEGGRPRLSDLRESGSIEQDADLVGLLVRPEYYETDDEAKQERAGEAELIIAKQRNGPTGDVPLTFLKQYTRFESRAREHA